MAERRAPLAVAALTGFACALLPLWDGLSHYSMMSALAGSGLGASSGAVMPTSVLGAPLLGAVVGLVMFHLVKRTLHGAAVVLAVVATGCLIYAASTAAKTACTRSHAIDGWNLCENPGTSPMGYGTYVSKSRWKTSFGGPHLEGGDPCVSVAEHRDVHYRENPDGDVLDGFAQFYERFPDDFRRYVSGTLFVVVALGAAAVLLRGEARRQHAAA